MFLPTARNSLRKNVQAAVKAVSQKLFYFQYSTLITDSINRVGLENKTLPVHERMAESIGVA